MLQVGIADGIGDAPHRALHVVEQRDQRTPFACRVQLG